MNGALATATLPRATGVLDAQLAKLQKQQESLTQKINGLQRLQVLATGDACNPGPDAVLLLYLELNSAHAAAKVATAQGWRLPSKRGPGHPPRNWSAVDVYALIRGEAAPEVGTPTEQVAQQALEALRGRGGWMPSALAAQRACGVPA